MFRPSPTDDTGYSGEVVTKEKVREICTVEGAHPNDLGFWRIASHIYEHFGKIDKKFL